MRNLSAPGFFFPVAIAVTVKVNIWYCCYWASAREYSPGFITYFSFNCFRVMLNRVGKYPIRDSISLTLADWSTQVQHASGPPQWRTADAEIRIPPVENPELKVLPLKPGVGQ